jgi:hypothetical protein
MVSLSNLLDHPLSIELIYIEEISILPVETRSEREKRHEGYKCISIKGEKIIMSENEKGKKKIV